MIEPQPERIATSIHLPSVDDRDRDEVLRRIEAAVDKLPEVSFVMSAKEAESAHDELMRGSGPLTHGEVLALIVPIVETLFDDTCRISPAFHAQLIMMCAVAWLLWAQGKRALAMNYLAEASRIDPDHPTAFGLNVQFSANLPAWLD